MKLLAELKRRNVIRMAGLYLVGAWLITQVASTVFPAFQLPDWALRGVIVLLAMGFLPALVIAWIFELTPEGLKRESDIETSQSLTPQTARRMDRMLLVIALLALGYFAVDRFALVPAREAAALPDGEATIRQAVNGQVAAGDQAGAVAAEALNPLNAKPIDVKSIAVLAFADLSQAKDQEYFSDGVAEEILNALAKIDDLKVAGRTSSFYFKGRNEALTTIGSTLGVAHVLEGSVRKQGERLRISAKLLRVSDGVEMWSESFDGTDADIFALQETIAQQVTSELKVALNAGQQSRLIDVGTTDPEAYALYLRATDVFNQRDVAQLAEAIAGLQHALQLDPQFARAHSRLATLYYVSATASAADLWDGFAEQATHHADQAIRLDPGLAEPQAVLSVLHGNQLRHRESRIALEQALRLDPNDPTANLWLAILHCDTGYIAACERGLDRTLAIDPLLPNALGWRSRLLVSSGDLENGERMSLRAKEVGLRWPGNASKWVALKRGDLAAARGQAFEVNAVFATGLPSEAASAFAGAFVGEAEATELASRLVDAYLDTSPSRVNPTVPLALIHMGQIQLGLEVFASKPTSNAALFLGEVMGTRLYPQVWASPAFPEFLRKTGLAAYWDEFGPPEHCRKDESGDYRCT